MDDISLFLDEHIIIKCFKYEVLSYIYIRIVSMCGNSKENIVVPVHCIRKFSHSRQKSTDFIANKV
jgi:hypothetical protein